MERVVVTRSILGICHMQVCAEDSVEDEEILMQANFKNPAGTTHGWSTVVRDGSRLDPIECKQHKGRTHYILSC